MSLTVPPGVRFNDSVFSEPVPLTIWKPPACAGILVILARNPQWGPKPWQPLYFAGFGNDATGTTSLPQIARPEGLLVSMLPLPYSSAAQRRALCNELIAAHNPACQRNGTMTSAAELAHRVEALEARHEEQHQQILTLLAQLGRLFAPQPVSARNPIGFLAQLTPAGAEATESGS